MRSAAILLAGGSGTRLRHSENKVYLPVAGRPLLAWSLQRFESSPLIDDIVVVIRAIEAARVEALTAEMTKLRAVVKGGFARQDSEHAGLEALADRIESGAIRLVLIHDAARPFVSHDLLCRVVNSAREFGGAVPGLPLETPVFRAVEPEGLIRVAADDLRRVQTPQAFWAAELLTAYRAARAAGFTGADTAESVQRFSDLQVRVVAGDPRNIKVTFLKDLRTAEELASTWTGGDTGHLP